MKKKIRNTNIEIRNKFGIQKIKKQMIGTQMNADFQDAINSNLL